VSEHAFFDNAAANFIGDFAAALLILLLGYALRRFQKKSDGFHVELFHKRLLKNLNSPRGVKNLRRSCRLPEEISPFV